jgi:L-ascorbate metabolism protein UlaG (beta-lactamase superfamily)
VSDLSATYLGHATAQIEARGRCLLTDPLLRPSLFRLLRRRHRPPEIEPERIDAVLISHVHYDHLDLPSLRQLFRDTPLVVPRGAGTLLRREGFTAVQEVTAGDTIAFDGLTVEATPAVHAASRRGTEAPPSLGYLIGDGEASVYFAGDTELFEGMAEIGGAIDLALLPVWGWGPTLGPGHMDPAHAAAALRLLRARRAVPIHWGTYTPAGAPRIWPWMSESPAADFSARARSLYPEAEVSVLAPGESIAVAS